MRRLHGFTLIELLIVVAIIAILAAIAVPNFLEAQVRSKVSRVKADMRSLATALEAYAVDNNNWYPPHNEIFDPRNNSDPLDQTGGDYPADHIRAPSFLTTPVAYITALFEDPFMSQDSQNPAPFRPTTLFRRITYWNLRWLATFYSTSTNFNNTYRNAGGYLMYSWGPDRAIATSVFNWETQQPPYDATNGTISNGNIYRTPKYYDNIPPINLQAN